MHPMLTIAIRAARSAGDIILRASENVNHIQVDMNETYVIPLRSVKISGDV